MTIGLREKFVESLSQIISEKESRSRPQSLAEEESADEARLQTAQKLLDWVNKATDTQFRKWFLYLKSGEYATEDLQESDITTILVRTDTVKNVAIFHSDKNQHFTFCI